MTPLTRQENSDIAYERTLQKYYLHGETLEKLYSTCVTIQKTYIKNGHYKSDTADETREQRHSVSVLDE